MTCQKCLKTNEPYMCVQVEGVMYTCVGRLIFFGGMASAYGRVKLSEKRVYMPAFLLFVPNVNVLTPLFLEKPPPRHTLAPFIFRQMTKQSTLTTRLSFFSLEVQYVMEHTCA